MYVATEKSGQMWAVVLLRAPAQERGTHAAMHKYYHGSFLANERNCDAQTRERGGVLVVLPGVMF
jgi:hypothetical protein